MRIQHNITAMNAYRNYTTNNNALSKNLEKLSSGYKINRAGDDAAGLAISEKMRAQITGLDVAQKNAQDGISLVQTAEGALTEVHDMLNRMVELANQSANGTYDDTTDRANLQKEVQQLKDEIDRIADSANFNGIQLLDGSMDAEGTGGGADIAVSFSNINTYKASVSDATPSFSADLTGLVIKADATKTTGNFTVNIGDASIAMTFTAASSGATAGVASMTTAVTSLTVGGVKYDVSYASGKLNFTMNATHTLDASQTLNPAFDVSVGTPTGGSFSAGLINKGTTVITAGVLAGATQQANASFEVTKDMLQDGATIKIGDQTFKIDYSVNKDDATGTTIGVKDLLNDKGELDNDDISEVLSRITDAGSGNGVFSIGNNGKNMITLQSLASLTATQAEDTYKLDTVDGIKAQVVVNAPSKAGKALTLQIGDTSDSFNKLSVSIQDMHVDTLNIADIDISTQTGAQAAVDKIKEAINTVSSVRGTLGATQNRLEHTINNLSVMAENIQNAESAIRDTDVAEEMMDYTKNNILIQSAQAMLAQANQVPQGVLQLLQ